MAIKRSFSSKYLPMLAYVYLCIPVLIFLIFWVKPLLSIPLSLAVVYSCFRAVQNAAGVAIDLRLEKKKLIIIFILLALWVIGSGVGGLVWQNRWDHMYRNAIFHDLVRYDWPVINLADAQPRSLCYYIGFWLPSALVGKVFGYSAGYVFQLVWAFFGVVLAFLLLSDSVKKLSYKVLFLFVFFSGLDILPYLLYGLHSGTPASIFSELLHGAHLELKLFQFNSSSNTTLLYWLYNQTIPFWVGFLLLLRETNNRTRLFTFMLLVLFAPFPAVALAPLLAYQLIRGLVDARRLAVPGGKHFLLDTFTFENATGFLASLVIALYFAGNASAGKVSLLALNKNTLVHFALYLTTEFLVFLPFVFQKAKKDAVFWILFGTMFLLSFVQMGDSYDFAWRTCIPAAFYIMLLLMRQSFAGEGVARWKKALFVVVILIGAITPTMELLRTTEMTYDWYTGRSSETLVNQEKMSVFDMQDDRFYGNFIGKNDSIFARYIQKD